ncbi:MAG: excinuclease ABC subunit UvrA [Veillonella sp.]|uniref:excinuclease ABC subunit UvrA n=1 Tax=Veillonella sp. TaxID=1926307 RepID=UPI0025F0102F|nr:excinuclease ABC subunit UvrA [Veillonella sp.]MBS4913727.1 excinuclease ABC subunit UvrA [Veillonella sp.]
MKEELIVKGARQHNLKNIDVALPRDKFIVITGLSGSGKSSLAFDTIYAEGQRRYVESLSAYARQFLGQMDKPDVDYIEGLSPAISIDQKTTSRNPRSTVGTVTDIYDYLRLLFARVGRAYCPSCGKPITQQSVEQMSDDVLSLPQGTKILIMAPHVAGKKGEHKQVFEKLRKEGFVRVRVDGEIRLLDEDIELEKNKKHSIDIVIDRLVVKDGITSRLTDSMETAAKWGDGMVIVQEVDGEQHMYSQHFACPDCHISLPPIEPRMFSFNSPFGACPACSGIGSTMEVDEERVIPDGDIPFIDGAVKPLSSNINAWFMRQLDGLLQSHGYSLENTYNELPKKLQQLVMNGSSDLVSFEYENMSGEVKTYRQPYEGILPMVKRRHSEATTDSMREAFEEYMSVKPCKTCGGARLKPEALAIRVGSKNIVEVTDLSISEAVEYFDTVELTDREKFIGAQILKEIKARLMFLNNVGLDYLTMSRNAGSLSGGEAQRIRLATQIGSGLVGVLYILDEPSIGLHQRDNDRLIATLKGLRDLGNTLLVVEHDEDTMMASDYLVDIGPGAGENGGQVVAQGTVEEVMANPDSITGQYLSGKKFIPVPEERRKSNGNELEVRGAKENNLKNINVKFPLGVFTVVTGVSGSGKSTLVNEILYKGLANRLYRSYHKVGAHKEIRGVEYIDKIINIDQSPIGRTPRSNPATYTGVFDSIRELYSQTPEAKIRGYKQGRFSFNVRGGRCEACRGDGIIKIEMHFLPDVYVPCEVCKGARYNRETLEVKYKGKSIADVLDMVVDEAVDFFKAIPKIHRKLVTLQEVGLGYIRLGQPATTLSGGEAQRVKLATELARRSTGKTLYILDEPTTGLHAEDIRKLLDVLQKLVDGGDTVVVIEHNLDVIKTADHIIDLGPEGGTRGGTIVGTGTPEAICKLKESYTGKFLKPVLDKTRAFMKKAAK